ncbi:MAG: hypothetical protein GYA24_08630 [Candidatus Lokiarchaeota archaeon]|nr:hypothetical protein [Candidatus Lokiarchaeota archaeon]
MAAPSKPGRIQPGFARAAIKPSTIDDATGSIEPGGVVFCANGTCLVHVIKYPRGNVYEYKGCTLEEEESMPDDHACQEFVEFYGKEFLPSIPPAVEAEIITTILGYTPSRKIDSRPRVIFAEMA